MLVYCRKLSSQHEVGEVAANSLRVVETESSLTLQMLQGEQSSISLSTDEHSHYLPAPLPMLGKKRICPISEYTLHLLNPPTISAQIEKLRMFYRNM